MWSLAPLALCLVSVSPLALCLVSVSASTLPAATGRPSAPAPVHQYSAPVRQSAPDSSSAGDAITRLHLSEDEPGAPATNTTTDDDHAPSTPSQKPSNARLLNTAFNLTNVLRYLGLRHASASLGSDVRARLFLPRRRYYMRCVETDGLERVSSAQDNLLAALNSNKDMLSSGQTSILSALSTISSGSTTACDLTTLENGQSQIINDISDLVTELDNLDGIEDAIVAAKDVIVNGQTGINTNIDQVSAEVQTAKDMIINGQTEINTNIDQVSAEVQAAKDMIINGQTEINTTIIQISTQIFDKKDMILAELGSVIEKVHALETGQAKIYDKIQALDAKLDIVIDKLMETTPMKFCPKSATLHTDSMCYMTSTKKENFDDAQAACQAAGGNLATMTATNENFLYELANSVASSRVWIGLTRRSRSWAWVDSSPYGSFTDWDGPEPSNRNRQCGTADAAAGGGGSWNDRRCQNSFHYICQSAPTTSPGKK